MHSINIPLVPDDDIGPRHAPDFGTTAKRALRLVSVVRIEGAAS
jgi:hypothetical protein